ncbi:hypothetical protein JKG47_22005 [Acidithiobacillus sp. MC6.1]|nr:hypothetical protein [Acidithiobacillus sp. MC6.1]
MQETVHKCCAPPCGWNQQPSGEDRENPRHQKHPDPLEEPDRASFNAIPTGKV